MDEYNSNLYRPDYPFDSQSVFEEDKHEKNPCGEQVPIITTKILCYHNSIRLGLNESYPFKLLFILCHMQWIKPADSDDFQYYAKREYRYLGNLFRISN